MCRFCEQKVFGGHECGDDYEILFCGNGDLGVRAKYMDGGIILFVDRHTASGYFDINYCPICGRRVKNER